MLDRIRFWVRSALTRVGIIKPKKVTINVRLDAGPFMRALEKIQPKIEKMVAMSLRRSVRIRSKPCPICAGTGEITPLAFSSEVQTCPFCEGAQIISIGVPHD